VSRPVRNYVHKVVLQFLCLILWVLTLMWSVAFSLSCFLSELRNLVTGGSG
jgi:hypothetical protein